MPDVRGRKAILDLYLKKVPADEGNYSKFNFCMVRQSFSICFSFKIIEILVLSEKPP